MSVESHTKVKSCWVWLRSKCLWNACKARR